MNAPGRETPGPSGRSLSLLHVIGISPGGGSAATALRQMTGMAARGHRVICATAPGLGWAEKCAATGVELREVLRLRRGFRPFAFLGDVNRLKRLIRSEGVDVVHLHKAVEYLAGAVAAWRARRDGRPKVVRSRGVVFPVRGHFFNRILHNRLTDRVIVTATAIEESYKRLAGFDPAKLVLIHDGIDVAAFDEMPDRIDSRRSLGLPEDGPVVGCVARASAVKGHRHLLDAFARIREVRPDARLFLATYAHHPNELDRLRRVVAESGLGEAIVLHEGYVEDPRPLYAAMDIYILASVGSEGSSRATLEAMASALPVVATQVGVLPDIVENGRTGLLVPPGEPTALAEAVERMLSDRAMMGAFGEAGRALIEERFDESTSLDRIERLYLQLAGGPA